MCVCLYVCMYDLDLDSDIVVIITIKLYRLKIYRKCSSFRLFYS